ncbi:MAG: hypothetical protein Q8R33_24770 [Burkholderiales bacterium]|nr:hypothetical protein [Burkholderiales bacterium]
MDIKTVFITTAAILMAGMAGQATAGDADFTLVNRTGYDIREVYISPANKNNWGRDRLGDGTLNNGKARLFKFADRASCVQDLKVIFDDDASEVTWEDFDLCQIEKVTIRYNRSTKKVSADVE